MAGPLSGLRIIEFAGIGPGPFCAMMLADHGAEVIRIERPGGMVMAADALARSRRSITINTKTPDGVALAKALCRTADGVIEGYRPGVMERLGLGPDVLLGENPELVYGRMTGWGQEGPLAHAAGHDINYIAISGVLSTVGEAGRAPVPPVNYVGDFGGGAMMLAFGMVAALLEVGRGGKGQVVDAAMTDGSALLAAMTYSLKAGGQWRDDTGVNMLDGGAHFYATYACADGKYVSIGSIEPQFYALLCQLADLPAGDFGHQFDVADWPTMKQKLAEVFKTRTRDEWCAIMEGSDVCFAPVLTLSEAPQHPHNLARETFVEVGGHLQPGPAPRYSQTVCDAPRPAGKAGADTDAILMEIGLDDAAVARLRAQSVVG